MKLAELLAGLPVTAVRGSLPGRAGDHGDHQGLQGGRAWRLCSSSRHRAGPSSRTPWRGRPRSHRFGGAAARRDTLSRPHAATRACCLRRRRPGSTGSRRGGCSVTGITGTNGKTTVTYLIESIVAGIGGKGGRHRHHLLPVRRPRDERVEHYARIRGDPIAPCRYGRDRRASTR